MAAPESADVLFRRVTGKGININIPLSFTVGEVKVLLARKTGTPPENQIIVFSGKKMDDDVIFAETGVRNESALMLVETPSLRKAAAKPSTRTKAPARTLPVQRTSAVTVATAAVSAASIHGTKKSQQTLSTASAPKDQHSAPTSAAAGAAGAAAATSVSDTRKLQNQISSPPSLPKAAPIEHSPPTSATPAAPAPAAEASVSDETKSQPDTQPTTAAVSSPVVESKSSTADAASAALSGTSSACTNTLSLHFRTLDGAVHIVQTTEDSTFGFIKYKFLQQLVKFPAIQIRIIFYGSIVKDDETPIDIDCGSALYVLHHPGIVFTCHKSGEILQTVTILKRCILLSEMIMKCCNVQTEKILEETIPLEGELKVNCRFCHTRGAAVSMRPKCNLCGQETAILDTMSHITRGESLWNDITNSHGECLSCNKKVDVAWGFLCTATINGKICPSRRVRDMIIVYQPGKAPLVDTLNELYGYAHAGGFEACIQDAPIDADDIPS